MKRKAREEEVQLEVDMRKEHTAVQRQHQKTKKHFDNFVIAYLGLW